LLYIVFYLEAAGIGCQWFCFKTILKGVIVSIGSFIFRIKTKEFTKYCLNKII
jgi:hypothetical protein